MQKKAKYVIFRTQWGYFGLAGTESALYRTCLPVRKMAKIEVHLLGNDSAAQFDADYFKSLQKQIVAYYEGDCVNFDPEIPVSLDGFFAFSSLVLTKCRQVRFGQTITYGGLAKKSGRPAASRAVGGALARNPLPLIIPCHRVLRNDGGLGGFSAPGGVNVKKRMLELERQALSLGKMSNYV
ncbi:MAG: methylated-DNA--[protein]-cysteine S-methyltransferase [Phycisphaerales bacterium]|nr:MAG: methylated-DNA--[protein]-cysteine S-methyltransferase [Phycisphaerales bacterium]